MSWYRQKFGIAEAARLCKKGGQDRSKTNGKIGTKGVEMWRGHWGPNRDFGCCKSLFDNELHAFLEERRKRTDWQYIVNYCPVTTYRTSRFWSECDCDFSYCWVVLSPSCPPFDPNVLFYWPFCFVNLVTLYHTLFGYSIEIVNLFWMDAEDCGGIDYWLLPIDYHCCSRWSLVKGYKL